MKPTSGSAAGLKELLVTVGSPGCGSASSTDRHLLFIACRPRRFAANLISRTIKSGSGCGCRDEVLYVWTDRLRSSEPDDKHLSFQ